MDAFERVYRIVVEFSHRCGIEVDGFQEDVAEAIVRDNGEDLSRAEIEEMAKDFFEDWEG